VDVGVDFGSPRGPTSATAVLRNNTNVKSSGPECPLYASTGKFIYATSMATLYTIGHSTRMLDELIEPLQAHSIQTLVDIRSFPMSRRLPHFNRESLEKALPERGIRYVWMRELGGRRKSIREDSPNIALRNDCFRNYADYMLTEGFERAIIQLVKSAEESRTAYMCAERVYFHCHRMLVSDWLVAHGHEVLHIDGVGAPKSPTAMAEARVVNGQLIYRGDRLL
jgi:uncharacterized protein (DUF488 family)